MKKSRNSRWLTIVSAAMMIGQWDMARAASPSQPSEQGQRSRYSDGVFTATGKYGGQPSFITVTVTLKNGLITAVAVKPHATVPRSLELQRAFADAVPQVVVGKPIDRLRVGKLAGSSGTPDGFNDAIEKIRQQSMAGQ